MQAVRYKNNPMEAQFKIFDIAPYGVPYALWGFIFVVTTQSFLLPGNSSKFSADLLLATRVLATSGLVKKSLIKSGLLNLHAVVLEAISRRGTLVT